MKALKKIINIIIDIFIVIVVLLSIVIASISLSAKDTGVPSMFGYVPLSVQTESMSPTFVVGDLIIGKKVDTTYEFKKDDVITYWMIVKDSKGGSQTVLNTHRIIGETKDVNGNTCFITKGDHNTKADETPVNIMDVVSVWESHGQQGPKVSKLGGVLSYLKSPDGFLICVVVPMAVFFIYELFRFIVNLINYNKEKSREAALKAAKEVLGSEASDSSGLSEEERAQAILDYMEKQKKNSGSSADDNITEDTEVSSSQTMEDDK